MSKVYRNVYQIARMAKGYTQEKAAELIDISVESIRAYESDRIPPTAVVLSMIDVYEYPVLAHQHLKFSNEIAASLLPDIPDGVTLAEAVLSLMDELHEMWPIISELRGIAKDNIIDEEERPRFDRILAKLQCASAAIMMVRFANTKNDGKEENL